MNLRDRQVSVVQNCEKTGEPVDTESVWPVSFDCNTCETSLLDEPVSNVGTVSIELVGAMCTISDQHDLRIA